MQQNEMVMGGLVSAATAFAHLDATTVLSRGLASKGPTVDPFFLF